MDDLRIYSRHLRQCGFCLIPGGRDWFNQHNLDWRDFIKNGILVESIKHIDDDLARKVLDKANTEYKNGK